MTDSQRRRALELVREADRQRAIVLIDADPEIAAEVAELNRAWFSTLGLLHLVGH